MGEGRDEFILRTLVNVALYPQYNNNKKILNEPPKKKVKD
jgi:hypothetical protein